MHDPTLLPSNLPVPFDDGAARHLLLARLPADVELAATDGGRASLAARAAGACVVFLYPRTGVPGRAPPPGFDGSDWDAIPGARGCTPQACGFRDLAGGFAGAGVDVLGLSTNTTEHQRAFRERTGMPFELLSDASLALTRRLGLPTFEFPVDDGGPTTHLRRMAWYCQGGVIRRVWYPVFPPDRSAAEVLGWLGRRRTIATRAATESDRDFVVGIARRHWHDTRLWSMGRRYDVERLPAVVAEIDGQAAGLAAYFIEPGGAKCEVVALASLIGGRGVGSMLLEEVAIVAKEAGCGRLVLTTSNDNLPAMGFYQRRGWRMAAVHRGAMDEARARGWAVAAIGIGGVPCRDDVEFELLI